MGVQDVDGLLSGDGASDVSRSVAPSADERFDTVWGYQGGHGVLAVIMAAFDALPDPRS